MTAADRITRILEGLADPADRAALLSIMPPWMRRSQRLEERDEAIRHLAAFYPLSSGREIARRMRADLVRVATRGRRECDAHHLASLRMVLGLSAAVPGERTIRAVLAGLRGQNSGEELAHLTRDDEPVSSDASSPAANRRAFFGR